MDAAIIVAILGVVFAPLLTYLIAARKLSGKIQTSEAGDLWEEASKLRQEYREEAIRLSGEIAILRRRLEHCESVMQENIDLRQQIKELREIIGEKRV